MLFRGPRMGFQPCRGFLSQSRMHRSDLWVCEMGAERFPPNPSECHSPESEPSWSAEWSELLAPFLAYIFLIYEGTHRHWTYYLPHLASRCSGDLNFHSSPFVMRRPRKWHSKSQWGRTPSFFPRGIAEPWLLSENILLISRQYKITLLPLLILHAHLRKML